MDILDSLKNATDEVKEMIGITPDVSPVEQPQVEVTNEVVSETPEEVSVIDRSAYNCQNCKGEGLTDQYTICPKCGGTGKVN